ncbi:MAG: MraY family glycosyltransferase [Candidatus Acidiferrales bacterium]
MTEMKFILEAALAFLIVFVSTPIVILVCNALKLYDPPGPLKIHTRPVPRLGGVAVTAGLLTAIAFVLSPQAAGIAEFAACIAIVAVLGIVDDLRGVSPYVRLAVQVAVGTYMGTAGWGIALTNSSIVNALIASAVVVLFINAFNFLDGADSITAGVTAAIALAFILAEPYPSALSNAIAWSLLGCSLAFLTYNWPPARVLLGDSGSTVIGLAVSFLALEHWKTAPTYSNPALDLFPFVVAAVPLIDAALAIARRVLARTNPLRGDRCHWYDELARRGFAPRAVAIAAIAATIVSGVVGWIALHYNAEAAVAIIAAYLGLLVATGVGLGSLPLRSARRAQSVRQSFEV